MRRPRPPAQATRACVRALQLANTYHLFTRRPQRAPKPAPVRALPPSFVRRRPAQRQRRASMVSVGGGAAYISSQYTRSAGPSPLADLAWRYNWAAAVMQRGASPALLRGGDDVPPGHGPRRGVLMG